MVPYDALFRTKIQVPALHRGLISRKRLLDLLDSGWEDAITLLSAPAGCGKTSLLLDWIANCNAEAAFAWVTLDEADNDASLFLQYVIAALQIVDHEIGQSILPALQSPNLSRPIEFLPAILNQINQRDEKIILVLDDYHLISDPAVHQITTRLIERGSSGLHLVLATRADPPLPIYRYRAQGKLIELRQAHLNFTLDETLEFLLQTVGDVFKPEEIDILHQRTEGWVAGLLLAGLSLQESENISESVAALSGNQVFIMEYLTNEVLERQPGRIRDFLLKTSILKRLSGPLCDRLTGFEDGYSILADLKTKNSFVSELDYEQTWYRYHQLFADLLRRRLEREHGDELPRLHKAASDWYAQNDLLPEAIDHALASGDYQYSALLIEDSVKALWSRGESKFVLKRLQMLPSDVLQASASLCLWYSLLLFFDRQYNRAEKFLGVAEELAQKDLSSPHPPLAQVSGIKALQDAHLALYELDMERVDQCARSALHQLPDHMQMLRQIARLILADSLFYQGETDQYQQVYAELLESTTIQQNPFLFFSISIRSVFSLYARGKLQQAYNLGIQTLQQLGTLKPPLPWYEAAFHIAIGEILTEWNRLEEALELFDKAFRIFEIDAQGTAEALHLRMTRGYIASHQFARARRIIDNVEAAVRSSKLPSPNLHSVLACKARMYLAQDNISLADQVLAELHEVDHPRILVTHEAAHLARVRVWLLQGKIKQSDELLEMLQAALRQGKRNNRLIEVYLLRAVTEAKQKNELKAREYLEQAISLAEPEGFVRVFMDGGAIIYELLTALASDGTGPPYIKRLIEAFDHSAPKPQQTGLIDSLSARELQVLRLLRSHLSQQEIADELCISLNTIRFHTKNIYHKLGVHDRSSAVEKATVAGLL